MAQTRARKGREKEAPAEVGEVFAARLREAREARRWTQTQLSEALAELGAPMDRTTIAKLEKGQRSARVEELVAIAAALDVSPLYLFLPWRIDVQVKLAPKLTLEALDALRWARGGAPLDRANRRTYDFLAPTGRWVVWTPGKPGEADYGGGLAGFEARQIAREVEKAADDGR